MLTITAWLLNISFPLSICGYGIQYSLIYTTISLHLINLNGNYLREFNCLTKPTFTYFSLIKDKRKSVKISKYKILNKDFHLEP